MALVALVMVALPVAALTHTRLEDDLKKAIGLNAGDCEPATNLASAWTDGPDLPYKRDEPRAATIDGRIYLVGGTLNAIEESNGRLLLTPTDAFTRFDPATGRYEDLAPLPRPLNHVGVVAYRGNLYVLGGYGTRADAHTGRGFYRYDPDANHWSHMPDMPEPRAAAAVGVIGHTLIVAGGARDKVALRQAFAFDFRTKRWSRLPDMRSRREHVGGTVVDGKLYVLGGRAPQSLAVDTAERYDPQTRDWERLAPMPVPTGGLTAVAADGKAIAIGGGNDEAATVTGAVQVFDPTTGGWNLWSALRTPRHGHGAAVAGNRIWVFGGSACAYFNPTERVESLELPASHSAVSQDFDRTSHDR
jgi:N-acetylneuraminic acid mutarotase